MTAWQASAKEIVAALKERGWQVELAHDGPGWSCTLRDGEVTVTAAGVTQLSCLWAVLLELIKLIPRP